MKNLIEFIRVRDEYAKNGGNRAAVTLQLTFMEINLPEIPEVSSTKIDVSKGRFVGHRLGRSIRHLVGRRSYQRSSSVGTFFSDQRPESSPIVRVDSPVESMCRGMSNHRT